jgi:hypothetical protein
MSPNFSPLAAAAPSNACATNSMYSISTLIFRLTLVAEGTVVKDTPAMSTSVVAVEGNVMVAKSMYFIISTFIFRLTLVAAGTVGEDTPRPVNETSTMEVTTLPSISAMPVAAQSDSAGRWYAVTVGKEVGVFTNWLVSRFFPLFLLSYLSQE